MRTFKTEAIIIKRRNFGEADRIITVFTKEHGKFSIKASGVRKITSRRSAHVEPLNHSLLSLYKGNGFPILTEARILDDFSALKTDLNKIGLAYHLCELIDGLCPENQEQRGVFELLKNTLDKLTGKYPLGGRDLSTSLEMTIPVVVHEFEVELLSMLGYWNKQEIKPLTLHDTPAFMENIMERKLKSRRIFSKLQ